MSELPVISTAYDFESDRWELQVTYYNATAPAGPRLFRADAPAIEFSCATEAEAKANAAKLQDYLNLAWPKKKRR